VIEVRIFLTSGWITWDRRYPAAKRRKDTAHSLP